ncbi:MAG: DHH family phosphoesterase [Candidatus Buchananbacteria bacterium]
MNKLTANRLRQVLLAAQQIVLVCHRNPDADTLGSALALWWWLKNQGITSHVFCLDPIPEFLNFLPGRQFVINQLPKELAEITFVFMDCASLNYTGLTLTSNILANTISLDHHQTNNRFAALNLIEARASSTAEVVFHFFQEISALITSPMASNLLCGIITDTGGLTFSNTSLTTFNAASRLLLLGAKLPLITNQVNQNKELSVLQIWGLALASLQKNHYNLVFTVVPQSQTAKLANSNGSLEGLANFLNSLKDGNFVLVLQENNGKIKGSLRTTKEHVDVSRLAKMLGGGGHRKAAGFTLDGQLEKTKLGWKII